MIYLYVFRREVCEHSWPIAPIGMRSCGGSGEYVPRSAVALLCTCTTIYYEACAYLSESRMFQISFISADTDAFLRRIGPSSAKSIHHLQFCSTYFSWLPLEHFGALLDHKHRMDIRSIKMTRVTGGKLDYSTGGSCDLEKVILFLGNLI
jgi:hypothetical protein